MKYEIWAEGYKTNGECAEAILFGTAEAPTFKAACDALAAKNQEFKLYYTPDTLSYWGCRLFDNETDARKTFG